MLTYGLDCTDYISVGRMLYSICVVRSNSEVLTLSRNDERMRLLCTHLVSAHILVEGALFSLNMGKNTYLTYLEVKPV